MPDPTQEEILDEAIGALWLAERRVGQLANWRGAWPTANKIARIRKRLRKAYGHEL